MKAKVWVDGKKDELLTVSLISDVETGESRLTYSGRNPRLKEFFDWTSENDHNADTVTFGLDMEPLLPVRPSTFTAFVHRATTWATLGLKKTVRYSFEGLNTAPGNLNEEGKESRYL